MSVAVFQNSRLGAPDAVFEDLATALAWGRQQWPGQPFIVRLILDQEEAPATSADEPRRGPQRLVDSQPASRASSVIGRTR